jgi:hypothetical protein
MSDLLRSRKGIDTLLTEVAYANYQAESLIPFVAPTVTVQSRSGRILTFGKEQFAITSTKRTPYANHRRSGKVSGYSTNLAYVLEQHTHDAEVSWEEIDEAMGKGCQSVNIDLKELSILDAVAKVEQSLEHELYSLITNPANYEAGNVVAVSGVNQFSNAGSDPEALVMTWKSIVRAKTGKYPTRAVISEDVYRALALHPIFRDRTKYTTTATTDLQLLASWLGLSGGIEVALRQTVDANDNLVNMFPNGTMLLFIDGRDRAAGLGNLNERQPLFKATPGIGQSTATFAQLYSYKEGLTVGAERINEDNDTIVHTVRFTGSIVLPSVGATSKAAAGVLVTGLV